MQKAVFCTVIMLCSGFLHSLIYDSFPEFPAKPATIAFTYTLALLGLHTLAISVKAKTRRQRYTMLITGFLTMQIAFYTLEALYKSGM